MSQNTNVLVFDPSFMVKAIYSRTLKENGISSYCYATFDNLFAKLNGTPYNILLGYLVHCNGTHSKLKENSPPIDEIIKGLQEVQLITGVKKIILEHSCHFKGDPSYFHPLIDKRTIHELPYTRDELSDLFIPQTEIATIKRPYQADDLLATINTLLPE